MSFWNHLKPAKTVPAASSVEIAPDQREVLVTWMDGQHSQLSARALRQGCPCAECVDEWTSRRTFDPAKIPEDMRVTQVQPVGNYAVSFVFGDTHGTGIFTWSHLRTLSALP